MQYGPVIPGSSVLKRRLDSHDTPAHGNTSLALKREGSGGDNVKNLGHIAYQPSAFPCFKPAWEISVI